MCSNSVKENPTKPSINIPNNIISKEIKQRASNLSLLSLCTTKTTGRTLADFFERHDWLLDVGAAVHWLSFLAWGGASELSGRYVGEM